MRKNKLFLLLALLLTAATGAWAQTETLLTTIESTANNTFTSGSKTFDDIATVTFSNGVYNDGDEWGWYAAAGESSLLTVAGADGYTITRVKFYSANGSAFDEEAPFEATVASTHAYVNGTDIGQYGVNKIEVYGYEGTAEPAAATGYTVSLKDGVKDADKWTVKVGEGQAQALPIGGLKGDGSETVTLQYNGRLKVKGVKATSDAAAPTITLNNTITAWTAGSYAVPTGGLTYSDAITVSGNVTLTLTDGETLTLNKGISLASGATLTIQGNGTMNVNGTNNSTASTVAGTGMLVLTSGTLNAKGGDGGNAENFSISGGGNAINGAVTVSGGTLTATGGNGGSVGSDEWDHHGGNGGDAINGSVIVSGGTLTARGGNGGSLGPLNDECSGGNGGDAISGTLTINGGSTSVNDGSNGSIGSECDGCTAGKGGKGHN